MSDSSETPRSRDHLRLVAEPVAVPGAAPAPRPRTIGRLIAQTALIADSAVARRRAEPLDERGGMAGRLFSRFR